VKDAPTPKTRKKDGEPEKNASDFIELLLVSTQKDDKGEKIEILLDPNINLHCCKKYLFDLMEIETKTKLMPLYYRLKDIN
jgi:hypothetical protein